MDNPAELISVADAARLLGLSVWTVHRRIKDGRLTPVTKFGPGTGAFVLRRADVEALVEPTEAAS